MSKKTDQLRPSRGEFKCHRAWAERLNHPAQAGASVHAHTHRRRKPSPTENRTQGRSSVQCFHSKFSSQDFPRLVLSHFPWGLKKKEDTIFYITLSHVIMTHHNLPMTPHFHFAVQTHREKYQQPDSSGRLNRKNARSKEKTKNKIQVVTSLTEGAA